jgi:hypothetical protein
VLLYVCPELKLLSSHTFLFFHQLQSALLNYKLVLVLLINEEVYFRYEGCGKKIARVSFEAANMPQKQMLKHARLHPCWVETVAKSMGLTRIVGWFVLIRLLGRVGLGFR